MAEGVPYLVYVGDTGEIVKPKAHKSASQTHKTFLKLDVANDPDVYGDAEYLDFSTEEEFDSNTDDDESEFNNEVEMLEMEVPAIKREIIDISQDNVIEEQETNSAQQPSSTWNQAATVLLIKTFQTHETSLITGTRNISQVWDEVASKMQETGFIFTPLQCKNKFVSLKQIYDKIKEQEIHSGKSVKKWMYLDLMEPIMTEMEKYRSYSTDAWDSPNCEELKEKASTVDNKDKHKSDQPTQGTYKWENSAILFLIDQYRKYQSALESGSISQKVLFRLVEKAMQKEGYNVTATQCIVKYHSLKKTYKSIKEYNQVNRLIPRRWRYYDLIDSIVQGTPENSNYDPLEEVSETLAEIKSEAVTTPHIFKWNRRAIEILATAYKEHRPPLHDSKMSRHKVWQIVTQKLLKAGYEVTVAQCKSKISGMLKLYRRNKAGGRARAWNEKGNWYSKLIESIVEKTPKAIPRELPQRKHAVAQSSEAGKGIKRADNVLDQLVICEENKERRHRENREQRQQLIDIMRQLVDKL